MKFNQNIPSIFRAAVHAFVHRGPPGGVFLGMHRASLQASMYDCHEAETVKVNSPPLSASRECDCIIASSHECTLSVGSTALVVPIESQVISVANGNDANEIVPFNNKALSTSNQNAISCIAEEVMNPGINAFMLLPLSSSHLPP